MFVSTPIKTHDGFSTRIEKLRRSHTRLARGYKATVGRDGLIVFRPKRQRASFPLRGLLTIIAAFICFKALVLAHLGEITYLDRATALSNGTLIERACGWMMQIDPLTRNIAAQIAPLI